MKHTGLHTDYTLASEHTLDYTMEYTLEYTLETHYTHTGHTPDTQQRLHFWLKNQGLINKQGKERKELIYDCEEKTKTFLPFQTVKQSWVSPEDLNSLWKNVN